MKFPNLLFGVMGCGQNKEARTGISGSILRLRRKKKLSQAELAQRMGVKQIEIIRIESGKQNLSVGTLEKVAEALGCELKISLV